MYPTLHSRSIIRIGPYKSMCDATIDPSLATTRAIIHLDRLRANVDTIRTRMPGIRMMGVVKADAYGHGAIAVARVLEDAGIEHLGVATVAEGLHLRREGIETAIMVFAPIRPDWVTAATTACLDIVVDGGESVRAAASSAGRLRCHLKVDTGMGRLGRVPKDAVDVLRAIEHAPNLDLGSIWTHFARADEPDSDATDRQMDRFDAFISGLGGSPAPLHVAASAGVFAHPRSVDPSRYDLARVGIAMYGLLDLPDREPTATGLQPVMELVSRVTALKKVSAGTPVSYGSRWTAPRDTWIATVGAGYADGVSRHLSNVGAVRIRSGVYPIVGTVCMDMFMVDIGPEEGMVDLGDDVILFGAQGPTAFDVARQTDSITYVPVCAVSARVPRMLA